MSENKENTNSFRVVIASLPDREKCVCEIYYNHTQWVEISQENDEIMIQFYSHPSQSYWEFPLNEALEILQKAKKRFLGS
jgi:hypothetical protein